MSAAPAPLASEKKGNASSNGKGTQHGKKEINNWVKNQITVVGSKSSIWWFLFKITLAVAFGVVKDIIVALIEMSAAWKLLATALYVAILYAVVLWRVMNLYKVHCIETFHPVDDSKRWCIYNTHSYAVGGYLLYCILPGCECSSPHLDPTLVSEQQATRDPRIQNLRRKLGKRTMNVVNGWAAGTSKKRTCFLRDRLETGLTNYFAGYTTSALKELGLKLIMDDRRQRLAADAGLKAARLAREKEKKEDAEWVEVNFRLDELEPVDGLEHKI